MNALLLIPVLAQWVNAPVPKIDLRAPAPKLANGKPDFSGSWMPDDNKYARDLAADMKPEDVPYQPWAKKVFDERKDGAHSGEDPDAHCLPQGVPKIDALAYPFQFVETPKSMVIIYETFTFWRQVFTDGRKLDPNANPTWLGYSTGKWEGDTLVVDTRGFNGKLWLDQRGRPSTEKLHVIERFRRVNFGTMKLDVTIDDPGAYTRPWGASQELHLHPGWEPGEFICAENNKDVEHLPGKL